MNEELSRDALIIYLNDVRTMEMILRESDQQIDRLKCKHLEEKEISEDIHLEIPKTTMKEPTLNKESYDIKFYIICIVIAIPIICIFWPLLSMALSDFSKTGSVVTAITASCFLLIALVLILAIIRDIIGIPLKNKKNREKYYEEQKKYDDDYARFLAELKTYNEKYDALQREKKLKYTEIASKLDLSINEIKNEVTEITGQLEKAYNANIIPLPFRNIYGVTYLYDYLSTSNQTLGEALMQANLESIKSKLDNVIQLQAKSIIQQAKANAALYQQNQKILATAQATMQNTAVAAKYAEISAVNSTLSLKLQAQQLAYQKADFWLK